MILAGLALLAAPFTYNPPGELESGTNGRHDQEIYAPNIRFPIEQAPAYPNSQVYGVGGSQGASGNECDARNYSYPWSDNYCEPRSWDMPLCPSGTGHQGQDIRAASCADNTHWVVAAENGTITTIGEYSVYHMGASGVRHRYLHMEPSSLRVSEGQHVTRGERLGRVSDWFGGTPTTNHLHYDLYDYVAGVGNVYVPTYMSLVRSYEELVKETGNGCDALDATGGTIDDGSPCVAFYGPMDAWRRVTTAGYGGDLRWTNTWTNDAPGNWVRWRVDPASYGRYRVRVHVVPAYSESQRARYRVRHADRGDDTIVDLAGQSGWVTLGVFDFSASWEQWVELYDNTGETPRRLTADALRLVRLDVGECAPLPAAGGIVDNATPCFELFGPLASWRFVTAAGYDGSLHWTYGYDGPRSNWARWTVRPSEPGLYRVSAWIPPAYADSRHAPYTVRHAGVSERVERDIRDASGWIVLGDYDFAAAGGEHVAVGDDSGEAMDLQRRIPADAVRLVRLDGGGASDDAAPAGGDSDAPSDGAPPAGDAAAPGGDSAPAGGDAAPPGGDAAPPGGDAAPPGGDSAPEAGDSASAAGDPAPEGDDPPSPGADADPPPNDSPAASTPRPHAVAASCAALPAPAWLALALLMRRRRRP